MAVIVVEHVTKEFQLGQLRNLRQTLARSFSRLRGGKVAPRVPFKALDDINLSVEAGEVLGIIGTNGAGKSTLLKLLARIAIPTSGRVRVKGKIAPLIEVGAGLISDLTGRENIYLNGIILGMPYAEIRRKFDEIVAFAELEEFIDTPLKRYSSGMAVRLGFSIATAVDADLLIVDEVLAVGDLAFQRKCFDRMEDIIKRQGKTVLLVSHNTRQIERLCSRVILVDHGHIVADGSPGKVCNIFYERSDAKIRRDAQIGKGSRWANAHVTDDVKLLSIEIQDASGKPTETVSYRDDWNVCARFVTQRDLKSPVFGIGIHTTDFLYLARHNSEHQVALRSIGSGVYEVVCRVSKCPLLPGVYGLLFGIWEALGPSALFYAENLVHFQVTSSRSDSSSSDSRGDGFFALDAAWSAPDHPLVADSPEETAFDFR